MNSNKFLPVAGAMTLAVALFQFVLTFSPLLSRSFGAPEIVYSNLPLLYTSSLLVTALFIAAGLYAFSGAGAIRRLPMLRTGLVVISVVFTLRGMAFVPEFLIVTGYLDLPIIVTPQTISVSAVSLIIGITYIGGTISGWNQEPHRS